MRILLLSFSGLCTAIISLSAQVPSPTVTEVFAPKGELTTTEGHDIAIDWGDGKIKSLASKTFALGTHESDKPLTKLSPSIIAAAETYAVSIENKSPDMGTIGLFKIDGMAIESGSKVEKGTVLEIQAVPNEGCTVKRVSINDKVYEGNDLAVQPNGILWMNHTVEINTSIIIEFEKSAPQMVRVTYTIPEKVNKKDFSATVEGVPYKSGDDMPIGSVIMFELKEVNNEDGTAKYSNVQWAIDGIVLGEGPKYAFHVQLDVEVTLTATVGSQEILRNGMGVFISLVDEGNTLLVDGLEEGEPIQVFNISGQKLLDTCKHHINTSELGPGIYIVRTAHKSAKVIK